MTDEERYYTFNRHLDEEKELDDEDEQDAIIVPDGESKPTPVHLIVLYIFDDGSSWAMVARRSDT